MGVYLIILKQYCEGAQSPTDIMFILIKNIGYKRASPRANMYAKLFLFLGLLLLTQTEDIESETSTESGKNDTSDHPRIPLYHYGGKSYYFELDLKGTRDSGASFCKNLNMELVSIMDEGENAFLNQTMKSLIGESIQSFWTSGITYGMRYYWMPSVPPMNFTDWGVSDLSTFTNGNCLALLNRGRRHWKTYVWEISACGENLNIICKSL
ncbi:hypothetical protein JTB14_001427 [Gonioctena quinquepunctata]|nr:hypothetical protein JTB14_001427 [Gonioctena quinquepunctata]